MHYPFVIIVVLALFACEEVESIVKEGAKVILDEEDEYSEVPGENASDFFSKAYKDSSLNPATILELLALNEAEGTDESALLEGNPPEVSDVAVKALNSIQTSISNFKPDDFSLNDNSFFTLENLSLSDDAEAFKNDTVNWSRAESEFTISSLDKMPAKDQGRRGTCASFAGIGQIEGYLIKTFGLSGIDLSEQRFYFMSKPEHWIDGGDKASAGSNSGTGFAKSNGYEYDGHTCPPNSPQDFNIPLESSCPYNPKLGDNDLQTPQTSGCETGVARVDGFNAWVSDWEERPKYAQDIYGMVANEDIPAIVATKLSANWEKNDGMITLADAGSVGDTGHAAGHAYLVVGARKLDESKYPNEGGMCFIIKNSWGKGWGVGGISCMTLAWFNEWRYPFGFPSIKSVSIDTEKISVSKENVNQRPEVVEEPDESTKTDINRSFHKVAPY
ncbi:MAG: C1 family peptidase [Oligoflexales bacterium]|nr:C1 family peptidase [Oligoflexales bacterium]